MSEVLSISLVTMNEELEQKFVSLLEEHTGILYKITRLYALDAEDEKDLRQEVIYQAWRSFPRFEGRSKFSTWFYQIALNTALTHTRKSQQSVDSRANESADFSVNPDEREWLIQQIRDFSAIEKLVIMLHLDGYPNEEISAISGLSKNHVAVKLHRLKVRLVERFQKSQS